MVELYIDGVLSELDGVPSLAITKTFELLLDPAIIKTASSKTIRLPATRVNNDIFNRIGLLDASNYSFNPLAKTSFLLAIDGIDMMVGYLKLTSVEWYFLEPRWYNITLFEATGDVLNYLKGLDVADIPMPYNNLSHIVNAETVADTGNANYFYFRSYQGQYEGFESDRYEPIGGGEAINYDRRYDENEIQEYRSYYQRIAVKFSTIFNAMIAAIPLFSISCSDGVLQMPYFKDTVLCLPPPFRENEAAPIEGFINKVQVSPQYDGYNNVMTVFNNNVPGNKNTPITYDGQSSDVRFNANGTIDVSGVNPGSVVAGRIGVSLFANIVMMSNIPVGTDFWMDGSLGSNNQPTRNPQRLLIRMLISDAITNNTLFEQVIFDKTGDLRLNTQKIAGSQICKCWTTIDGETYDDFIVNFNWPIDTSISSIKISFDVTYANSVSWTWYINSGLFQPGDLIIGITNESSIYINNQTDIRSDSTTNWSSLMPKGHTQLDLFTSFIKSFGLIADYDMHAKQLTVKTRNEFFEGWNIVDWTDKIDYSHPVDIQPLAFDYRYASLEHVPSKSYRNKSYLDTNNRNYGEQIIDTGYGFNETENSLLGNSFFTAGIMASEYGRMYNGRSAEIGRDDKVLPLIAERDAGELKHIDESLELMFDNGIVSCQAYRITDDTPQMVGNNSYMWYSTGSEPGTSVILNTYRQLARVKPFRGDYFSLDFGKPTEAYYPLLESNYPESSTIYARQWQNYLRERLSKDTRVMTAYVYLTPTEFFDWKFNKFVRIEDTLWHVNNIIDFNPLITSVTKVELFRVQDINAYISGQYLADGGGEPENNIIIFGTITEDTGEIIPTNDITISGTITEDSAPDPEPSNIIISGTITEETA